MNQEQQVKALEKAILDRAHGLADEIHAKASHQRDGILRNTAERLHLTEQREVLAAKAAADRNLRRRIQAGELKLQGRLEKLRWQLVLELEQDLRERIAAFHADRERYLDWLAEMIREATTLIPDDELVGEVNSEDMAWLGERWQELAKLAAPDRQLQLNPQPFESSGGIRISSMDNRVRLDNRFEGRLARRSQAIRRIIQQQLFRQA